MSSPPQNDPPTSGPTVGRGGLWHRLWAPRAEPKAGEPPIPGSSADIQLHTDLMAPAWDASTDTADLTKAASTSPTEAMEVPDLDELMIESRTCTQCSSHLDERDTFCKECGYVIPKQMAEHKTVTMKLEQSPNWHERYTPERPLPCRPSVQRWLATARQEPNHSLVEVYYSLAKAQIEEKDPDISDDDTVNLQSPLVQFNQETAPVHLSEEAKHWPGARWLHQIITRMGDKLPAIREYTVEGAEEILVLDPPTGTLLWDAWDQAPSLSDRFRWLSEVAELLQELHRHEVIVEALRPEMFIVKPDSHVAMTDLTELLPLPVPSSAQMKGALSTAPDLILAPELADARADLYPFGAMVYALHHGRELTDLDFDGYGVPRSFVSIFPDGHPFITQVVLKTFTRYAEQRYPTQDEDSDQTGFSELITQLRAGEQSANSLRFDVAGWSSTGLERATNEDAFAVFHACGFEQDRWGDQSLIILADGMGGCNAGEVASALAIKSIGDALCSKSPWTVFQDMNPSKTFELLEEEVFREMHEAIQQANTTIHAAAEHGDGTQIGMGCTCEAAFLMQGRLFMGHVGDSRAFLYRSGTLRQLTQDQTLVNRMVAMGVIKPEEAESHPRRHELDQALGSSHPVEIQLISEKLQVGDILVFCSDGLTTHVNDRAISEVLRNTASAETAARRLVNLANALGGSDNVTVVVVRVA
ncbi:MAG TPA: protein phosphatase 2C domain-containing protein [Gemmatales bacterium]|nr:protein phosphatase 2C domain-containing protein [Gemmatales bacterium]